MTTTPIDRIRSALDDVFGPVRARPGTTRHRLLLARSVLAYLGLVATLVQVVVWLMVGVFSGDLDTPWWLWTTVPAAVAVAALTAADGWSGWYAAPTRSTHTDTTSEVTR